MYSTEEAYELEMGEAIANYELRERLAVAKLGMYCLQFPLETEMETLTDEIQADLLTAIYHQIKFDYDNDLLEDNGNVSSAQIGKFAYDTMPSKSTGIAHQSSQLSNVSKVLVRSTGICSDRVRIKTNCWLDNVNLGCK